MIKTLSAAAIVGVTLLSSGAFAQSFPGGDDAEARAVQAAVSKDLGGAVSVQAIDGVIYLHGHVGASTAERAEQIARGVVNGGEVVNATVSGEYQG